MGTFTNSISIKQENGDSTDEVFAPKTLATKIYLIEELMDPNYENCTEFMCIPEAEVHKNNRSDVNNPEYSKGEENNYQQSVIRNEEAQEWNSSNIVEMEYRENEEDYHLQLFLIKDDVLEDNNNGKAALEEGENESFYESLLKGKEEISETNSYDMEFPDHQLDTDFQNTPRREQEQSRVDSLLSETYKILLCPFCGEEFANSSKWRRHVNTIHELNKRENLNMEFMDNNKAKCKQCAATINAKMTWLLQRHRISHLPFNLYMKCKLCGKVFSSSGHYRHMKLCHQTTDMKKDKEIGTSFGADFIILCPFCGVEFPNTSKWRRHLNAVHEFYKRENLNMEYLGNDVAKCKECHMKLNSGRIWQLQIHKITHLPYKRYIKCALCSKTYAYGRASKEHMRNVHSNSLYEKAGSTPTDSKGVNNERLYIKNSSIYKRNVIHLCPFSGTEFDEVGKWREHLNDLHGFNKRENLTAEYINMFSSKCKECNAVLGNSIGSLQSHKIAHQKYCEYLKCRLCGDFFGNSRTVVSHIKKIHKEYFEGCRKTHKI